MGECLKGESECPESLRLPMLLAKEAGHRAEGAPDDATEIRSRMIGAMDDAYLRACRNSEPVSLPRTARETRLGRVFSIPDEDCIDTRVDYTASDVKDVMAQ